MTTIASLISRVRSTPGCTVHPARGMPTVAAGHTIPLDLQAFFAACGGVDLFSGADYSASIVSPEECVRANPVLIGELCEEDRSSDWYIVARGGDQVITIDLAPARLGRCYDSFHETHGVAGSCAVVARSFTELLKRLLDARGGQWYWTLPAFQSLGDAYDDGPVSSGPDPR